MTTRDTQLRSLGFTELKQWLRHRHPMVLLDRITSTDGATFMESLVNVSGGLDFIAGHFPERAVYPGTHLIQAFSQTGIILYQMATSRLSENELTVVGAVQARFFSPAVPGDQIKIMIRKERLDNSIFYFSGEARVDNKRIAGLRASLARLGAEKMGDVLW